MPLPWHKNENRNFICMKTIVSDIVTDGLKTIFKQEWDSRYRATLGAWNNTAINGIEMHKIERRIGRQRRENLPKFRNGNINEWDCTVLFDAILYSECIGKVGLNPTIETEVDNLRKIRNKISHLLQDQLSEREFENDSEAVRNSFLALGLPTKSIDEIKTERKLVASFQVLPPQPSHEVIPRTATASEIIDDLHNLHKSNNGKLTFFYISGNPGSGKSQLASQIGKSHYEERMKKQNELTFVMTLNAESLDSLLVSYEDFARRTDIPKDIITSILNSNQTTDVKIRSLRTEIAARMEIYKNWLLIVDNVEDLKPVSSLLPERRSDKWKGGQVLITIQESTHIPPSNSFTGHKEISPGLDEKESCELLTELSGNTSDPHDMLKKVAEVLDYQPLALAAAAVYLQQVRETVSREFSWHDYLQKLDEGKRQHTEKIFQDINPAYPLTMTTAVLLAVEKVAENDVVLKHTFHFMSLASHESLPLEVAINHVLSVDKNQDKEQVGLTIRKCSLILPDDEVNKVVFVRLHRVVHDAIKVYARKREMEEISNTIELAATSFFEFMDGSNDRTLVPHLKAFYHAMTKIFPNSKTLYSENPSSEIGIVFSYLGDVLYRFGDFSPAKGFFAAALEIHEKQYGSNHVSVGISCNNLGALDEISGDLQQAKQYYEKALHIQTEQLGSEHVSVATCYINFGYLHQLLGNLQQAKQYYEMALDIQIKKLGSEHVNVAKCYSHLGILHRALGDLQQAKQYHEKALDIKTKTFGSTDYVSVAKSYNNLGYLHQELGNLQQAKQYLEMALEMQIKQLGPKHVDVAMSYNNLGVLHLKLGNFEQAMQYQEEALEIQTEQFGSAKHIHVATFYNNLGSIHEALGNLQQAKQYYEKALGLQTEQFGSEHINVATSYNNLGRVHQALGNLQQAKQYHEKALGLQTEQFGSEHINVATSYNNLGSVHQALGNLQQAKQYHEKALGLQTEKFGSDHVNTVHCRLRLENLQALENQEKYSKCFYFGLVMSILVFGIIVQLFLR